MAPKVDQNSSPTLSCTQYYLESVGKCDCSLRSLLAKITIVALPIFFLIALFLDLALLLVNCATKKKNTAITPTCREDTSKTAFLLRTMKRSILLSDDPSQMKIKRIDAHALTNPT